MSKVIQVRGVPDDVHRTLKVRAAQQGRTLSDLVRAELVELAERPSLATMLERLGERDAVTGGEATADAIASGRAGR